MSAVSPTESAGRTAGVASKTARSTPVYKCAVISLSLAAGVAARSRRIGMRVGVFTALLANLSLDQVIEKLKGLGIDTVELGEMDGGEKFFDLERLADRCGDADALGSLPQHAVAADYNDR